MSDKSKVVNIGPIEAGRAFEHEYIGDLPRMSFGGLLLEQNIEVI